MENSSRRFADFSVAAAFADLMFSLCRHGTGGVSALRAAGAMPHVITLLIGMSMANSENSKGLASSLGNLARQNPVVQDDVETYRLIERLLEEPFETDSHFNKDVGRVAVLTTLLKGNRMCQAAFLRFGGAQKVLVLTRKPVFTARIKEAALLIRLLVNESPICASAFCDAQALLGLAQVFEGSVRIDDRDPYLTMDSGDFGQMRQAVASALSALYLYLSEVEEAAVGIVEV